MVFARRPAEKMPKRKKTPPQRKFTQLDIPGLELVETGDEDYADGYEWYAVVSPRHRWPDNHATHLNRQSNRKLFRTWFSLRRPP